ncbi:MAG TPA: hypothetical protein PKY59_13005 [Pyrinomonadaceae bacterium]|nr:hypothetical protein [Pyrinomonadaceae bacterium]
MDAEEETENFAENKVYEGIFNIFELELEEISRFVAFTSGNMTAYSNKIHELHLRVCSEIENVLKIVIHKHFASADEVKTFWETDKSAFLENKSLTPKYEEIKNELNKGEKGKLDKFLFGFPDFLFYFKLACEKFNLHKKIIKFTGMVSHNLDWEIIQPFEVEDGRDVPIWWTNYNKLKHDKIKNFDICTLRDLLYSMSGLFILMNYLLKYPENNTPVPNRNFALDKLRGSILLNSISCSFESKFFKASVATQSHIFTMILPIRIAESDFQNLTILDLEIRQINRRFSNITEYENCKINDFDLKSFDYNDKKLTDGKINNRGDFFNSVEHAIFYSYLDYRQVINWQNEYFRELQNLCRFIN